MKNAIHRLLAGRRHEIVQPFVGNLFTSLDMMGVTVTIMKLDDELRRLLLVPAHCVGLTQRARTAA